VRKNSIGSCFAVSAIVALTGCGRHIPNDPAAEAQAAKDIRMTLVSSKSAAADSGAKAEATKATGWGTIKGRFVYDGKAPAPAKLSITQNQEYCGKPPTLVDESLEVGNDGSLSNVVLYLRSPKNVDVHPDYDADKTKTVVINNEHCRFNPHIITYRTGQPLELKNSDPATPPPAVGHNINGACLSNSPFNIIVPASSETQFAPLQKAEQSPVVLSCNIHPWMKGYLVVQPHPYMAVTGTDGTFELKNVPAGIPLEFQAWHEASTSNSGGLAAEKPEVKWQPNGRFTVTLQPDQVLDLKDIKVPAAALAAK
jgi:hypothetical protein